VQDERRSETVSDNGKERNPYPLRWMIPLTALTLGVVAGHAVHLAVLAVRERLRRRPEQEVRDGESPVPTLFRSMDERRDT
jgi:hypothetical protein